MNEALGSSGERQRRLAFGALECEVTPFPYSPKKMSVHFKLYKVKSRIKKLLSLQINTKESVILVQKKKPCLFLLGPRYIGEAVLTKTYLVP